jgi:hypothetical protein
VHGVRQSRFDFASLTGALLLLVSVTQAASSEPTVAIDDVASNIWPHLLSETELKALLPGLYIEHIGTEYRDEKFVNNGSHVQFSHNREIEGTFSVENERVCVIAENTPKYCRFIWTNQSGAYFFSYSAKGSKLFPIRLHADYN